MRTTGARHASDLRDAGARITRGAGGEVRAAAVAAPGGGTAAEKVALARADAQGHAAVVSAGWAVRQRGGAGRGAGDGGRS